MSDRKQPLNSKEQIDMFQDEIQVKEEDVPIIDLTGGDTNSVTISAPPIMYNKPETRTIDHGIRNYYTATPDLCNPVIKSSSHNSQLSSNPIIDCSNVDHGASTNMERVNCYHDVEIIRKSFPNRVIYCPTSYQYKTARLPYRFPVTMTHIDLPNNISVILDGPEATFSGPSGGYNVGRVSNLDYHPTTAVLRCPHCSRESIIDPSSRAYSGLLLKRSINLISDLNIAKYSKQKAVTVSPLEKIKNMLKTKQATKYSDFHRMVMVKRTSDPNPFCSNTPGVDNLDGTGNRALIEQEPEIVSCKYDIEDIYGWGYISKTDTLDCKSGSYCVIPLEDVMLLNQQIKSWFGYDGFIRTNKTNYNYKLLMSPYLFGPPLPMSGRSIDPRENAFDRGSMIAAIENLTQKKRDLLKSTLANPLPGCSKTTVGLNQPEVKIEQPINREESTDIIRKLMTDRADELLRQLSREGK